MTSIDRAHTTAQLVDITIHEGRAGVYFATSVGELTLFISATSLAKLWRAIPPALESIYSAKYRIEMKALPTEDGEMGCMPWVVAPKKLLAEKVAENSSN